MPAPSQSASRAPSPLAAYILFILLFLSLSAALVSLCAALGGDAPSLGAGSVQPTAIDLSAYVFVIDAGHGGEDGGALGQLAGQQITEKAINLSITLTLEELLADSGATVILTRREDTLLYDRNVDYEGRKKALDMAARLAITEQAGVDDKQVIFVSIHQNAFGDARYSGLQVYYSPNDPRSAQLASLLQSEAKEQLAPDNDRATKCGGDIFLLKHLQCPAVLVECGFLSNPEECAALASEEYQNRVAYAILCALREYAAEHLQAN